MRNSRQGQTFCPAISLTSAKNICQSQKDCFIDHAAVDAKFVINWQSGSDPPGREVAYGENGRLRADLEREVGITTGNTKCTWTYDAHCVIGESRILAKR